MRYLPFWLAGLLAAPLAGPAQSLPRYYAGLGLYSSTFQQLGYRYNRTTLPVQGQVGYRFHPRWALQLGVAYSGSSNDFSYSGQYLDGAGNPIGDFSSIGNTTVREVSVSLLARRTLTRQAAHRFQVDAVGGLTYEGARYHDVGRYVSTAPGYPADQPYDYQGRVNRLLVGLGPGLRFRAAPRLEVLLDVLLNAPLSRSLTGFTSATSLGVRYHFGAGL